MSAAWEIRVGDAVDELRKMEAESVHCIVTSPPYWGLRDYGVDGQLGLEETPEEYVAGMVEVFREARRVLRPDGTLWLNLGDSYVGNRSYQVPDSKHRDVGNRRGMTVSRRRDREEVPRADLRVEGLKAKDLVGIPWRVAFALQADGWWLRSDIVWAKPNPMPESVRDRPTKAHEYIFLLSKDERYFYDADAVAEESVSDHPSGNGFKRPQQVSRGGRGNDEQWTPTATRNRRTVWEINTKPFPEAHFAVYPPELVEPCIRAGTSERGCCPRCGAPWERVREKTGRTIKQQNGGPGTIRAHVEAQGPHGATSSLETGVSPEYETVGWRPTCEHEDEPVPCTVLDTFSGAGTTGLVSLRLGRSYVGIELNPDYAEMSRRRIDGDAPLFNRFTEAMP